MLSRSALEAIRPSEIKGSFCFMLSRSALEAIRPSEIKGPLLSLAILEPVIIRFLLSMSHSKDQGSRNYIRD